jgi:hypothetical protein
MSTIAADAVSYVESHIKLSLIRRCALSPAMISRIKATEAALGLGFGEAALALNLITEEDINAVRSHDRKRLADAIERSVQRP